MGRKDPRAEVVQNSNEITLLLCESPKLFGSVRKRAQFSHSVHECTILHGWAYHRRNRGDCQLSEIHYS